MTCFGLLWTQAAASMEVHTLGRALPENSGFDDLWVSRQMAKSVVRSWLKPFGPCKRTLVQLPYVIGIAKPLTVFGKTYGTEQGDLSGLKLRQDVR